VKLRVSAAFALDDAADVTPGYHTREAHVSAGDYLKSGSAPGVSAHCHIADIAVFGFAAIRYADGAVLLLTLRREVPGNLWSAV
jgi:hypothetical protein